jgi:hypothetical protein
MAIAGLGSTGWAPRSVQLCVSRASQSRLALRSSAAIANGSNGQRACRSSSCCWTAIARDRAAAGGTREGHYMAPSLLDSQFAALERPDEDERALTLHCYRPIEESARRCARLGAGKAHA